MTDERDFDSAAAEDAVGKFLSDKLYPGQGFGMPFEVFDSKTPGVIAIERISFMDQRRFNWDELAASVARETGVGVVCIAHCDWQVERPAENDEDTDHRDDSDNDAAIDDTHTVDEEAILIAFDIPELDNEYRDDPRNMIEAVSPADAPSTDDFKTRDKAVKIVSSRKLELSGKLEYLEVSSPEYDAVMDEVESFNNYPAGAANREIHAAVIALEFQKASELIQRLPHEGELAASPKP